MTKLFCILNLLLLSACASLDRSPASGYATGFQGSRSPSNLKVSRMTTNEGSPYLTPNLGPALAELGLGPEALNDPTARAKLESYLHLKNLERLLTDEREKRQYYNSLPWLKSAEEKITLLELPGYEARQLWLRKNEVGARPREVDEETDHLIEAKDIALGMQSELVRRSWGTPDFVEVAGNPIYRNERWRYKRYQSGNDGYRLQSRNVYFEGGRVVGWETIDHQ